MSIFCIPKKTIKTLDSLGRGFFWAGEDACSGAQCLIAWKNVCTPKMYGGLGLPPENLLHINKQWFTHRLLARHLVDPKTSSYHLPPPLLTLQPSVGNMP